MKRYMFAVLVALPLLALAAGVSKPFAPRHEIAYQAQVNSAASAVNYGAVVNPRSTMVQAVTIYQSSASGGGAGSTIVRLTDGTSNCDATYACTATAGTNVTLTVAPTGACYFAKGATVLLGFSATTCTTTQPGIRSIVATGLVFP